MNRKLLQGLGLVLAVVLLVGILWWQQRPGPEEPAPSATWYGRASERAESYRTRAERRTSEDTGTRDTVDLADLPPQARDVHARLLVGGPFEYTKDGTTYHNRNRLLPSRSTGFYREFTVPTPGEDDRGARRLVVGGCGQQVSGERGNVRVRPCGARNPMYWTDDHYDSFRRVTWSR